MLLYFDDLDDFIEKNLFILDGYKDRVLSLQEINESLISFRTNSVMKILTIFSVALLPLTLLSGIYGMNIDLPFAHDPTIIWTLFLLLLGVIGGYCYIEKKRLDLNYEQLDIITIGAAVKDFTLYPNEGKIFNTPQNLTAQKMLAFEYGAKINLRMPILTWAAERPMPLSPWPV
jgi:hypothetical protein